jgi:hypothetical protein
VRYFFVLLWGYLDDRGRGLDVPRTIAGDCFPHDEDVSPAKVGKWLDLMATSKTPDKDAPICRYEVAGRRYVHCVNWREHQRPNRPTGSRLPPCPIHEPLSEEFSEPDSDALTESSSEGLLSDSVPGAGEQGSRGAGEQGQPGSEPLSERLSAAAATIIDSTDATATEAGQLAAWIDRERRPRNLAGLIRALAKGPDLVAMLADQRERQRKPVVAEQIANARKGPLCEHGEPGGAFRHPTTGQPLCPLCRRKPT